MPLINVSYAAQVSESQKAELIAELTKTYARVMGTQESSVWVMLNEVPRADWGVGGQSLAHMDVQKSQPEPTVKVRQATSDDMARLAEIEAECFPATEAASLESLSARFNVFGDHFWVLEADGEIVSFINGMVTDSPVIFDELFEDANAHTRHGAYQSIFGINTLPDYRGRGYAATLINKLIEQARDEKRTGVILTCKEELIGYYSQFGFELDGVSDSTHGGARWHDMTLHF
ncbi:GNAT family N-acetyltransferase [Rothia terrae]|uniref:GNAT family N-acetyltransferase n=1 Tax=Rothia terrae TaxID=396015 RepID=UPI0028811020|nr:GNAT family N-acetyltransferase [Rothia terrae]MDT0188911.1 GNAT family N-acetyltransferase [Rothia terrae]